jgi:hypothetical protein
MYDWKHSKTKYTKGIRLTEIDFDFIMENKSKKSAAGFLEQIILEYRKPNLFKNAKNRTNKK